MITHPRQTRRPELLHVASRPDSLAPSPAALCTTLLGPVIGKHGPPSAPGRIDPASRSGPFVPTCPFATSAIISVGSSTSTRRPCAVFRPAVGIGPPEAGRLDPPQLAR